LNITDKLICDFIVIGIICGIYLQYKGFKAMNAVPAIVERGNRALTRDETLKLVESVVYALMGAWFEILSFSQAMLA